VPRALLILALLLAACGPRERLPEVNWPFNFGWDEKSLTRFAPSDLGGLEPILESIGNTTKYALMPERTRCRVVLKKGNFREVRAVNELEALRVTSMIEQVSRYRVYKHQDQPVQNVGYGSDVSVYAFVPPRGRASDGLLLMYFISKAAEGDEFGMDVALCTAYAKTVGKSG
jgi:hypothetical protein